MKSKSVFTVVLFYSMVGMLFISIDQNMRHGFAASYAFYMLTFMLFLGYTYRKINESKEDQEEGKDLKTKQDPGIKDSSKSKHK